jgi:hypothetical protein
MSDAPQGPSPSPKPGGFRKRWLVYGLAGAAVLGMAAFSWLHTTAADDDADEASQPAAAVFHIKKKPAPLKLGIEYHFDRNAIVDSRLMGGQLLGLTTSGNLVTLDAETFAARKERVLRRRATCLGPADQTQGLAGISNGAIVRVSGQDLAIERVGQVPGIPRWLGVRSKDGAFVVAYQLERRPDSNLLVTDEGQGRTYDVGIRPVLFLDSKDRLWVASGSRVWSIDLLTGTHRDHALKSAWSGVRGFVELADGAIWTFGGTDRVGGMASFAVRLSPDPKPTLLYAAAAKPRSAWEPTLPITHILEDPVAARVVVVSHDNVGVSDRTLSSWQALDGMTEGGRDTDAFLARGKAHLSKRGILLNLVRGGIMEVTAEFARRHVLEGQNPVLRPSETVRLANGMAFYGDNGPIFYADGTWHPLPEPIMPPSELQGPARAGEKDRSWVATTTIPIEGQISYVITKAGPPRRYPGHIHGLRDVFLTARWDGTVLSVLGREDLPIEPDDTFVTPDRQLWNVDDQGLWNFNGGHWRMVMRLAPESVGGHGASGRIDSTAGRANTTLRSAIGEPLHFAYNPRSPFHGLPRTSTSWSLVRLDSNEAGGVPLIDEIPIKLDGRRVLLRDLTTWGSTKDGLLLATNRGLCAYNTKFGNCDLKRPEGLDDEVGLFMRDGTKRLWLGGRGLWVLRDERRADAVHPFIPMLADTTVVTLAETPDGRLVIGTADRGTVFLTLPQGWFQRPTDAAVGVEAWEAARPHEPVFGDRSVVLRACPGRAGPIADAAMGELVASLRALAQKFGGRARVELEEQYDGSPDIAVRAPDPEPVLLGVRPLLEKSVFKGKFSLQKRFGPPGSESVEVLACP